MPPPLPTPGTNPPPSQSHNQGPLQYTITPWRYPSDLLTVRNNLYSPATPTAQAHAIATVAAWKLRGNVPHAVESTALLFDAMLFHARCTNSLPSTSPHSTTSLSHPSVLQNSFPLRAAYTTALSRFVTGFADLGRHRSGVGQSMFDVARSIALPPHFVELRHEGAHEEMPGLARLVRSAREAVDWLWRVYWGGLEMRDAGVEAVVAGKGAGGRGKRKRGANVVEKSADAGPERRDLGLAAGEVGVKVRVLFKEYRSLRVAKLKAGGKGKNDDVKAQAENACGQCLDLCYGGDDREKWETVVKALIDKKLIIPSLKQRGPLKDSALQGAYMLWDELLMQLARESSLFMELFLEQAIAHNAAFTSTDSDRDASDPAKWSVYLWLTHMLYSDEWESVRAQSAEDWASLIIRECSLYPNDQWSRDLVEEINDRLDEGEDDDDSEVRQSSINDVEETSRDSEELLDDDMEDTALDGRGWRQEAGLWKSLPIGVV